MIETSWTCVANGFRTVCSSRLSDRDWTLVVSASVVAVLGVGLVVWRVIYKSRARLERVRVLTDSLLMVEAVRAGRFGDEKGWTTSEWSCSEPSAEDLDAVAKEDAVREATAPVRQVVFEAGTSDHPPTVAYFIGSELQRAAYCLSSMSSSQLNSQRMQIRSVPR